MNASIKQKIWYLLKLALSFFVVIFFIAKLDLHTFIKTFTSARPAFLIGAFALTIINIFVGSYRWYILLHATAANVSFFSVVRMLFIGNFFNLFVPGGIAGDVIKCVQSSQACQSSADAFSSVITDRVIGLVGLVFIALCGIFFQQEFLLKTGLGKYLISVCLLLLTMSGLLYSRRASRQLCRVFSFTGRMKSYVEPLAKSLLQYADMPAIFFAAFVLSLTGHLIMIISIYLLALALGAHTSFIYFMLFIPVIGIISMAPVTIGGIGIRDAGFFLLFPLVGMNKEQAMGTSLLFLAVLILTSVPGLFLAAFGKPPKQNNPV